MSDEAVVTATFGRRFSLDLGDGSEQPGRIKGKKLYPVCGDRVLVEQLPNEPEWLITAVLPRDNELTRPNIRGRVEVLAANLDAVVVIIAQIPQPDWYLVDAYLCAAELIGAAAAIVYNKVDLGNPPASSMEELAVYSGIGYEVVLASARHETGLGTLRDFLAGRTAVFVGQSGVGKSSILNQLAGCVLRATADVSQATREGRHKTVNSAMVRLENGGAVIDSPGVREYAPAVSSPGEIGRGFREIAAAASRCRFADCLHLHEPDCNVKAAVAAGGIAPRRYRSYRRMLAAARRLGERH